MISLEKLFKRDKGICHICTKRVERLADASRDHAMPKFHGGRNDNRNIFLAHKWCNETKGSRIFRVDQHKTGWAIVDPNGEIWETIYPTEIQALEIVDQLNRDKVYLEIRYK